MLLGWAYARKISLSLRFRVVREEGPALWVVTSLGRGLGDIRKRAE